jgi:hypothetical protein
MSGRFYRMIYDSRQRIDGGRWEIIKMTGEVKK